MVSTRGIRYKFAEGERVLCYEPDPTKAKVLYDSKVLGVVETKDKKGRKLIQYKIHFQGWNSSWDRRVNEDFVLKDTDENRQLQRDLAEKAQLQLAAYLYRRERKKRNRKESNAEISPKVRNRASSEDGSSCGTSERNETEYMRDDCDTESYSSSADSTQDEERVILQIGDKIKHYLDYDYDMIVNNKKQHNLPAKTPVVTILENFVKQSAIKLILCPFQNENNRRRNSQLRANKREKDVDRHSNTISILKEIADGLRLYFDFTLKDYLLYNEEKEQANTALDDENLKNFTYVSSNSEYNDFLKLKCKSPDSSMLDTLEIHQNTFMDVNNEDNGRRRLRSHRNEENDMNIDYTFGSSKPETCFSSIASTSSGSSTPHTVANTNFIKSVPSLSSGIPGKTKEVLQSIVSWQMLPSDAAPEPSMIFGAVHLARLIVKLPDFLNLSTMSDEKLKVLLKYLDLFISYLETHKELFGDHNYRDIISV